MGERRKQALRRLRNLVIAEAMLYIALLLLVAATYGGSRGGWAFAVGTVYFLLVNGLLALTYPLWSQALDYPIGSIVRDLRPDSEEDRFAQLVRDAHSHRDAGRIAAAYRALQAAQELRPDDTAVLFELAEVCERNHRQAAARRYYARIVELGPLHSPTRRLSEARERVTALDPDGAQPRA